MLLAAYRSQCRRRGRWLLLLLAGWECDVEGHGHEYGSRLRLRCVRDVVTARRRDVIVRDEDVGGESLNVRAHAWRVELHDFLTGDRDGELSKKDQQENVLEHESPVIRGAAVRHEQHRSDARGWGG